MTPAFRAQREQAKRRQRRIILNNDGNEPVYLIEEPTVEELLKYRTSPLPGSQVDTVFYATWCSGFSLFTHLTKVGKLFLAEGAWFNRNKMQALADANVDPLQVMNDFVHQQGMEFFWSLRMNDTHDAQSAPYAAEMFAANEFKAEHPEYLLATEETRPRYGSWTAVDFAAPEVRDLTFRFVEEVCENYDVDGIELDFFRHPVFFHAPARGFACSQVELDLMTDLVRRIRRMTEEVGRRRGRPILVAIRLPDSGPYCRAIGLDIERWLGEDLLDLLIPGGYLKLSPWETTVELGHRHGAVVYPALDESRVKEAGVSDVTAGKFTTARSSDASYRARAANVWRSGADGVYLYNFFNPASPILRQLGEMDTILGAERRYFASVRGVARVAGDGYPHESFIAVPTLNPQHPRQLHPGQPVAEYITVGENPHHPAHPAHPARDATASVELLVWAGPGKVAADAAGRVRASVNGHQLELAADPEGLLVATIDPRLVAGGRNRVEVLLAADQQQPALLADARLVLSGGNG
jgi:hypothetical protein